MQWKIDLIEDGRVVRITTYGVANLEQIQQMSSEALSLATEHGVNRALADHRQMAPEIGTTDIYDLPAILNKLGFSHDMRLAILRPSASEKQPDFEFYETVSRNQGYQVRLFTNPEEALQWLRNEDRSSC